MKISARNQLPGTVESVQQDEIMAEVVVLLRGGERIVSAITAHSAQTLGLAPGKPVIVADKKNGAALDASEGPYRVIVPDEPRPARWAKQVVRIRLVSIK